jgi:hypothetical protein
MTSGGGKLKLTLGAMMGREDSMERPMAMITDCTTRANGDFRNGRIEIDLAEINCLSR